MKLATTLTFVVAHLAAAGPLSLLRRDDSPTPPMLDVDLPELLSENDDLNISCGTDSVSQRDLRHAVEWGTNIRASKHASGKKKYPRKFYNLLDKDNYMQGPLFRMSEHCTGAYVFEFPVVKDGYYAGGDDTNSHRAFFTIVDTNPNHLKAHYCGTAFRNKKQPGGYEGCDLEYFWGHEQSKR